MSERVHVVVAVIEDKHGKILIAQRQADKHMGGYWEFPGGKVERGEKPELALKREILEEVGIDIVDCKRLIQVPWQYKKKSVLLDVFKIVDYSGEAEGRENQAINWVSKQQLTQYQFPLANKGIINSLLLPDRILVTGVASNQDAFLAKLEKALLSGVRVVQLRAEALFENPDHNPGNKKYLEIVDSANKLLSDKFSDVQLFLNTSPEIALQVKARYLHLKSPLLHNANINKCLGMFDMVSASVHNEAELEAANNLGLDFIYVSPVLPTTSHPDIPGLGWEKFESLVEKATMPVYALGGMKEEDLPKAIARGAQGIAAISTFWGQ